MFYKMKTFPFFPDKKTALEHIQPARFLQSIVYTYLIFIITL